MVKVYINRKPVYSPWGGGIKTVNLLCESLKNKNFEVVHDLNHDDISIIFIVDPRTSEWGESYHDIHEYSVKKKIKIIQRVGDLGLHSKPELTQLLKLSIPKADCVTYISDFAKNYLGIEHQNDNVINLAPLSNFYINRNKNIDLSYPVRILTHHWSNNVKKGFEYYDFLDSNLTNYDNKIEFTYIGNLPNNFRFKNSTSISPVGIESLIGMLPKHDFYLSASVDETGGNHVLEAIGAGLPVLYHKDGGGIVNYCDGYGIEYNSVKDMIEKIPVMITEYTKIKKEVLKYNSTLEDVVDKYVNLIRENII